MADISSFNFGALTALLGQELIIEKEINRLLADLLADPLLLEMRPKLLKVYHSLNSCTRTLADLSSEIIASDEYNTSKQN